MRACFVLLVTVFALCLAPRAAVRAQGPSDSAPTDDVRGLWVQRTSLTSPQKIATMVAAARDNGFNTLLVQVRGRGEAYYDSAIEPRASDLEAQPAGFDPLGTVLQLAHAAGLRVHAWINVDLVSSATTLPRSREHIVARHPEWLMVPQALAGSLDAVDPQSPEYVGTLARWTRGQSDTVEGLYLSPIDPGARDYQTRVVSRNRREVSGRRPPPRLPALSVGRVRLQRARARRVSHGRGRVGERRRTRACRRAARLGSRGVDEAVSRGVARVPARSPDRSHDAPAHRDPPGPPVGDRLRRGRPRSRRREGSSPSGLARVGVGRTARRGLPDDLHDRHRGFPHRPRARVEWRGRSHADLGRHRRVPAARRGHRRTRT